MKFFAALDVSKLKNDLTQAQKRRHDLTKLDQEFEQLLKWFSTMPNSQKNEKTDALVAKIKRQKLEYANMRIENDAEIARIEKDLNGCE